MRLSLEQVLDGFAFFARRHRIDAEPNEAAVRAALATLEELHPSPRDEPAAVFFAFASHGRCFPSALRSMTVVLARSVALQSGVRIEASDDELGTLVMAVLRREAPFEAVRAWFTSRTVPTR